METNISTLDLNKTYNYAQYLTWHFQERIELIKGRLFKMSPAPARRHQGISLEISSQFRTYLRKKTCKIYSAPFDVRLSAIGKKDEEIFTVVQPDICVICDKIKLDEKGCIGAPDLIVEILSPATAKKDIKDKFELYQENGVKEYWIVAPESCIVDVFELDEKGIYQLRSKYTKGDLVQVGILPDLYINLDDVFEDEEDEEINLNEVRL